jgi:hypothetical protein
MNREHRAPWPDHLVQEVGDSVQSDQRRAAGRSTSFRELIE